MGKEYTQTQIDIECFNNEFKLENSVVNLAIRCQVLSCIVVRSLFITPAYVLVVIVSLFATTIASAAEIAVFDGQSLHSALISASPGDDIVLYPGDYRGIKTESPEDRWHYFHSHRSGTANAPITLRSYARNDIQQLYGSSVSGAGYVFYLTGDHWRIQNLIFHTGQKGIMLDSANHNVFNNIAVHNVRDEGVHFRKSSSHNTLRNCHIYNTGRLKPGFGEAVYVGTHEGDRLGDHSNANRIGGCLLGPGVTAEAIDIKAGTINTIVEHNIMDATDVSGENYADSFIDIKGNKIFIRFNQMHWRGNRYMNHGIHVLKREHRSSNIYSNNVTLGEGMSFLKIGRGTVHAVNNTLDYTGNLFSTYSSGSLDSSLDANLPAVHQYTGFRNSSEPPQEPQPDTCLQLKRDEKVEIDLGLHDCIEVPVNLSGRLVQVWDSQEHTACDFRGSVTASSNQSAWTINANYAGTRDISGRQLQITTNNNCSYLIVRWL